MTFKLRSDFQPLGDQVKAIDELANNFKNGIKHQVLLGATGTGKTFTICNVIEKLNIPTLVLAHNKTLAGQLYTEIKQFFPENHVEYFISYYDYYQPEAYVASSDTYIEKDAQVNDEIDQMRHSATAALMEYKDTIIIASISCIYGLGDPETYRKSMLMLRCGETYKRKTILLRLVELLYERNDIDFARGTFRIRGDVLEIILASERKEGIRVEFYDEEIERIRKFDTLTGVVLEELKSITITPAKHFITDKEKLAIAIERIRFELEDRIKEFKENDKLLEAQRIRERTNYDLEMLEQVGYCSGVENYSRHLALREAGETPGTLVDFFGKDFLLIIDESHVTVSQVRGMYNGDRSRKQSLVDYGFRLPSALDNRPLTFAEFFRKCDKVIYVSATPGDYELNKGYPVVEQIIRPTGLLDPIIEVRPTEGQIDDLYAEIVKRVAAKERVLVTTLTIRMSEDLTAYLAHLGIKIAYLHSEIKALERTDILRDLRLGRYDVLVGINLLREGLDLPEVSLVAILDADKQGFLRSERSLIQTVGRAARNSNGRVIMYASKISPSMEVAIEETNRRRTLQEEHNERYNIVPQTIKKDVFDSISIKRAVENKGKKLNTMEFEDQIAALEKDMLAAAKKLDFEAAAAIRDVILDLKAERNRKR